MIFLLISILAGSALAQPQPFSGTPSLNNPSLGIQQQPQLGLDPNFGAFRTFQLSSPNLPSFGQAQAAGVPQASQGPSLGPSFPPMGQVPQLPQMPQLAPANVPLVQSAPVQQPSFPTFNQPLSAPSMTSFNMPNLFNLPTPAPAPPMPNLFQPQAQSPQGYQMLGLPSFQNLFNNPFPQMNLMPYQHPAPATDLFGNATPQQPAPAQVPQQPYQQQTFNGVIPADNNEKAVVPEVAPTTLPPPPAPEAPAPVVPEEPAVIVQPEQKEFVYQGNNNKPTVEESASLPISKEEVSAAEMPGEDFGRYTEDNVEKNSAFRPVTVVDTTTTAEPKVLDYKFLKRNLKEEALEIAESIEAKQREHKSMKLQKYRKMTDPDEIDVQNILNKVMDAVMPMQPKDIGQQRVVPSSVKFNV